MTGNLIVSILSIIVINIVLSGDNALVIGMASRRLEPSNRRKAIILGGGGAIVLRIGFTALAVYLLKIPFLQVVGGLILTYIAYQVLREEDEEDKEVQAGESLWFAVRTIITADVVMSLDNVLAIAGAAHGSYVLYIAGVALSMPPILFGSELLARLMNRFPAITVIGAVVLTITAARMVVDEQAIDDWLGSYHLIGLIGVAIVLTLAVLIPYFIQQRRRELRERDSAAQSVGEGEPPLPVECAGKPSQASQSRVDTVE